MDDALDELRQAWAVFVAKVLAALGLSRGR